MDKWETPCPCGKHLTPAMRPRRAAQGQKPQAGVGLMELVGAEGVVPFCGQSPQTGGALSVLGVSPRLSAFGPQPAAPPGDRQFGAPPGSVGVEPGTAHLQQPWTAQLQTLLFPRMYS